MTLHYSITTTTPISTILLLFLTLFLYSCNAANTLGYLCNEDTSGSSNKSANIDQIIPKLVSRASSFGHSATAVGQGRDKVYGLAQCRGDVSKANCSSCLREAAVRIRNACREQPDSRIWYDYCFLRYDLRSFVGKLDTSFGFLFINVQNVSEKHPENFNQQVASAMSKIRSEAVVPKNKGLGKIQTKLSTSVTLHALVHCSSDLSEVNCGKCIDTAVAHFPKYCTNRKGCKLVYSNCYVRYELYPFFFPHSSEVGSTYFVIIED